MEILKRPVSENEKINAEGNSTGIRSMPPQPTEPNAKKKKKKKNKNKSSPEVNELPVPVSDNSSQQIEHFEVPGDGIAGGAYTRVVIIGDYFVFRFSSCWPKSSRIKPFFIYKDKLSIDELHLKFSNHDFLKGSEKVLIIIMLGPHVFSTYERYKTPTCIGNHSPVEFVKEMELRKLQPKYLDLLINSMSNVKRKFEENKAFTVAFSYLPEYKYFKRLQETFTWARDNVQNCSCRCYPLGAKNARFNTARFKKTIPHVNRMIYNASLNVPNGTVFEFFPLEITFQNGHFQRSEATSVGTKDVCVLESVVIKLLFDSKSTNYVTEEIRKDKESFDSCLTNMRKGMLGPKTDKFRILLIGDKWLNFILHEWNVFEKSRPFFHCEDYITFDKIRDVIKSLITENEVGLVITHIPSGELFTRNSSPFCKDHRPLEYPVPHDDLLKNAVAYGQQLMEKMNKFYDDIESCRRHCGVVFLTCYPTHFSPYYDQITKEHVKQHPTHLNPHDLINKNPSYYETMVAQCHVIVDKYIHACNTKLGFETCDIFSVLMQPSGDLIFPLHTLPRGRTGQSPVAKQLFVNIQTYLKNLRVMCIEKRFDFTITNSDLKKRDIRYYKRFGATRAYYGQQNNPDVAAGAYTRPPAFNMRSFETRTPVYETRTPAHEARTPAYEARTPAHETRTLAHETRTPAHETRTPAHETRVPAYETRAPAYETRTPAYETRTPAYETRTPAYETRAPAYETRALAYETPPYETRAPVYETRTRIFESRTWAKERKAAAFQYRVPSISNKATPVSKNVWSKNKAKERTPSSVIIATESEAGEILNILRNDGNNKKEIPCPAAVIKSIQPEAKEKPKLDLRNRRGDSHSLMPTAAKREKREIRDISHDAGYSYDHYNDNSEYKRIEAHYEGKLKPSDNSSYASNSDSYKNTFPSRDSRPENNNYDTSYLGRDTSYSSDRYESYPGTSSSGYNSSDQIGYDTSENSGYSRNLQTYTHTQQGSTRNPSNIPSIPSPQNSNRNQQQTLYIQQNTNRNPQQNFHSQQNSPRNTQTNVHTQQNSPRNTQQSYHTQQNSTRSSQQNFLTQQNSTRNSQQSFHSQQNSTRNSQTDIQTQQNSTRNPQASFLTQQPYARSSQTDFYSQQNSTRTAQTTFQPQQVPAQNSPTVYLDPQNSARNPLSTYPVEQSFIRNPQPTYVVEQNFTRNPEAAYLAPQNFPRNHQGTYPDERNYESPFVNNLQSNQSFGVYRIW